MNGRLSIDVNGMDREYILAVPGDYDPAQAYRLVFAWHQLSGSAQSIAGRGYYGLEGPSAGQAIFVAPDGLIGNDNGDQGWWDNDGEDTAFYEAMLDLFTSELCIDEERIFSVGFSFGAMFSFQLACSENSALRAIAPQAGSVWGGCGAESRVATIGFVGTSDSLLDGHRNGISSLAENNGCSPEPVEMNASWCDGLDDDRMPCTCWEYQDCDAGYPVIECEYNAGHTFAPNSGQTIWDFFSQF
jgi:poly(3-hydroxybutyrate) depolymerase